MTALEIALFVAVAANGASLASAYRQWQHANRAEQAATRVRRTLAEALWSEELAEARREVASWGITLRPAAPEPTVGRPPLPHRSDPLERLWQLDAVTPDHERRGGQQ